MKKGEDILKKINRNDGMTVPEGFFEDFAAKMEAMLPERPEAEQPRRIEHRTTWQRVRPYVYMAAMFAGIWCMLKMFTMMGPGNIDLSIDKNHILTDALSDDNFVYEYIIDDLNDSELFDEMYNDSISVEDFTPVDSLVDTETSQTE
jgi:hypothetical protein